MKKYFPVKVNKLLPFFRHFSSVVLCLLVLFLLPVGCGPSLIQQTAKPTLTLTTVPLPNDTSFPYKFKDIIQLYGNPTEYTTRCGLYDNFLPTTGPEGGIMKGNIIIYRLQGFSMRIDFFEKYGTKVTNENITPETTMFFAESFAKNDLASPYEDSRPWLGFNDINAYNGPGGCI